MFIFKTKKELSTKNEKLTKTVKTLRRDLNEQIDLKVSYKEKLEKALIQKRERDLLIESIMEIVDKNIYNKPEIQLRKVKEYLYDNRFIWEDKIKELDKPAPCPSFKDYK